MRTLLSCGLLVMATDVGLPPETPDGVKFDTPRVRVLVATEQPHRPSALHEHRMNRVLIYLGAGRTTLTSSTGKVEKLEFRAGDVRWSPAREPHVSENVTDRPFQVVEIEIKGGPRNAPAPASPLDPLRVDPKHYTLEFENDQVRVLRVHFGPREKGSRHEHTMDHLVVYLNDQARGKAGEVRLDGVMTHSEENPLDHPVERLAIDLK